MINTSNKPTHLAAWLSYLEQCHPHKIEMGLDRLEQVAKGHGLLEFSCPIITVAGTNGKGSTVAILAYLLKAAGLRVGSYTSPHLVHFKERIQIQGECLVDEKLCEAFAFVEQCRQDVPLTFFEMTTLAAFKLFQAASLDVLILEVGLGGRLDAVNAVDPSLAVITAIGYDHQDWLGQTLDDIAAQKAGILRANIPVVLSQQACLPSLMAQTVAMKNRVYHEGSDFGIDSQGNWQYKQTKLALPHCHLPINSVSIAFASYTILGELLFSLPPLSDIANCLYGMAMVGRFQRLTYQGIPVFFDVAHNDAGAKWLADKIRQQKDLSCGIAVWSSFRDKDASAIIDAMKTQIHTWCIAPVEHERALSMTAMETVLKQHGIGQHLSCATISDAFSRAVELAQADDFIVVFGSFYTVAPVLQQLGFEQLTLKDHGIFAEQISEQSQLAKGWH